MPFKSTFDNNFHRFISGSRRMPAYMWRRNEKNIILIYFLTNQDSICCSYIMLAYCNVLALWNRRYHCLIPTSSWSQALFFLSFLCLEKQIEIQLFLVCVEPCDSIVSCEYMYIRLRFSEQLSNKKYDGASTRRRWQMTVPTPLLTNIHYTRRPTNKNTGRIWREMHLYKIMIINYYLFRHFYICKPCACVRSPMLVVLTSVHISRIE